MEQTLCLTCSRPGTSTCSWDRRLKPVKGWTAELRPYRGNKGPTTTFHVMSCPLFLHDGTPPPSPIRRLTPSEREYMQGRLLHGDRNVDIARDMNVHPRVVARVKRSLRKKGLLE